MHPRADDAQRTDIARNALMVGTANFVSRVSGLLREVVFAAFFGAGPQADAFNAAFRVGSFFRELFAEGSLANAFVPLYADVSERKGEREGFALANAFLGVLLAAVGGVTLLTLVAARPFVLLVAGGFAQDPEKMDMAVALTRVMSPFVATVSFAAVFMGMLNVRGRFFMPAVVPVVFNALVIGACLGSDWFAGVTGYEGIYVVAVAALLGGASQALVQVPALRRAGFRVWPTFLGHPDLGRLVRFVGPALIAISVVQINLLVETQLASREGDGPVSWLQYSFRVAHLPLSVVSVAVGVASLTSLSLLLAQDRKDEFRRTLAGALNLNTFLVAPAAALSIVLAEPIVQLLFERGAFTPADTAATAGMMRMYGVALFGLGAHRVLVPMFYTLNDPHTPMWAGLATVAFKLPVAWALMYPLGFGVDGLPLSHAILVTAEITFLLVVLDRRVGSLWGLLLADHARVALAGVAMGAALWAIKPWVHGLGVFAAMAGGSVVYLVVADVLGMRQGREVLKRFLPGARKGLPPTVDADTQRLLASLDGAPQTALVLEGGVARVGTEAGVVIIVALDGQLSCREEPGELAGPRTVASVMAVMRVGGGPPRLAGLLVGEVAIRAEGDAVVEGRATGPIIPVR